MQLTEQQEKDKQRFRAFVQTEIMPIADDYDQAELTPPELIQKVAQQGYLGALIPQAYGGSAMDMLTFGILNEELGRGCSSIRSLITVHNMVASALLRWGSKQQKETYLPRLATGEIIAAFALSEPEAGSDAGSIQTSVSQQGEHFILHGTKTWITYGQIASLFLVFAQYKGKVSAFLLERQTPGLLTIPLTGLSGTRASMLAMLKLNVCPIPRQNLLGGTDFGLAGVATTSLDIGRYSVAWGCVGIAQACLEAALAYTEERKQFGVALKDHQLIQQMLTDMIVNTEAARLLCYQAGMLKESRSPEAITETWMAKYFASTIAWKIASDAVQIYGARGCQRNSSVQRYLRDAKIMEIIEGSSQIQQTMIASRYRPAMA